jgi:hypothetical protein
MKQITVDGVVYIPQDSAHQMAQSVDNMPFVLIRGYSSGVQYGYLKERNGCEVVLINSRRIWSWNGATETGQIAVNGIDAKNSKVTCIVPEKTITDAIEIINITSEGATNLIAQPIWKK